MLALSRPLSGRPRALGEGPGGSGLPERRTLRQRLSAKWEHKRSFLHEQSPFPRIGSTDGLFGTRDRQSFGFIDRNWMAPRGTNPPRQRVHLHAFRACFSLLANGQRGVAANVVAHGGLRWVMRVSRAVPAGAVPGMAAASEFPANPFRVQMCANLLDDVGIRDAGDDSHRPVAGREASLSILNDHLESQLDAPLLSLIRNGRLPAQDRPLSPPAIRVYRRPRPNTPERGARGRVGRP